MAYSLKEINDAVRSDPKGFAEACDAAFAKKVETAAQKIADHRKESRIILLSGPSGSGKTTTALKIEEQLEKMGIQTHTISMDNYFNTIDPENRPTRPPSPPFMKHCERSIAMAYSLKEINDAVRSDPKGFAEACDAAFAKKVETAAQKIADHRKESRIILLSGPSGSGKTTTALKIEEQLEKMGIQTHTISMDNYFNTIDPETAPRNREGAIDYESPFCLDIELLNRHFSMLDRGETIHVPKYEFARQMRSDILSQPLKLGPDELAIFEGIHALNDVIVGKNPKAFKLYIAARSNVVDEDGAVVFQHPWLRLCRRIVRDYKFRGSDANFTLKMWPNVRRGEKLYISPYKENADLMFDSSLPDEVAVLKPFVVPLLEALPQGKYEIADDILRGFERIEIMEESNIAPSSLVREFIGGSIYPS